MVNKDYHNSLIQFVADCKRMRVKRALLGSTVFIAWNHETQTAWQLSWASMNQRRKQRRGRSASCAQRPCPEARLSLPPLLSSVMTCRGAWTRSKWYAPYGRASAGLACTMWTFRFAIRSTLPTAAIEDIWLNIVENVDQLWLFWWYAWSQAPSLILTQQYSRVLTNLVTCQFWAHVKFLADRTAARSMIGCWHDTVVCLWRSVWWCSGSV